MKFDKATAGLIAGLVGTASGVSTALTVSLSGAGISGVWFAIYGAVLGISCAVGSVAFYVVRTRAKQGGV